MVCSLIKKDCSDQHEIPIGEGKSSSEEPAFLTVPPATPVTAYKNRSRGDGEKCYRFLIFLKATRVHLSGSIP